MKGVFFAGIALGAIVGVNAGTAPEGEDGAIKKSPVGLDALLQEGASNIDWANFSPSALGMNLNYDGMTASELNVVASGFKDLGLISEDDKPFFISALQDPRMRMMLKRMAASWPQTMAMVTQDPKYIQFLQSFKSGNEAALAQVVGLTHKGTESKEDE